MPAKAAHQVPDLPALFGMRVVSIVRGSRGSASRSAFSLRQARRPRSTGRPRRKNQLAEGAETFFSASSSRPFAT